VVSDQLFGRDASSTTSAANVWYESKVMSYSDYLPFGAQVTGRTGTSTAYRYGFNGKEKDEAGEFGTLTHYDYGFRIYSQVLGKFLSVDPLSDDYPELTSYQFASNTPILAIDLDGLEAYIVTFGVRTPIKRTNTPSQRRFVSYNPARLGLSPAGEWQYVNVPGIPNGIYPTAQSTADLIAGSQAVSILSSDPTVISSSSNYIWTPAQPPVTQKIDEVVVKPPPPPGQPKKPGRKVDTSGSGNKPAEFKTQITGHIHFVASSNKVSDGWNELQPVLDNLNIFPKSKVEIVANVSADKNRKNIITGSDERAHKSGGGSLEDELTGKKFVGDNGTLMDIRANKIREALIKKGIDPARISIKRGTVFQEGQSHRTVQFNFSN
jgi:RHS repeat-associated protein